MNNRIKVCVLGCSLLTSCIACNPEEKVCDPNPPQGIECDLPPEIVVGMDKEELRPIVRRFDNFFSYSGFFFFNYNGASVIIENMGASNNRLVVERITCYPMMPPPPYSVFLSLVPDEDDVYSIVKKIGIPFDSQTSGLMSMMFHTEDAGDCLVYFYYDICDKLVMMA